MLPLPSPTGRFAIGTHIYEWLDRSRHEKASSDPKHMRLLIVQAWYPAQSSNGPSSPYVPKLQAYGTIWDKEMVEVAGRVKTHSHADVPALSRERFPIVLFSHGWEGTRSEYTALAEDLASRGYIVFGVDHPYMGRIALPDGRVTPASETQFASAVEIMDYYGRDVQFVLDQVVALDGQDDILAHHLDLSRVAAIGHSSGFSAVSNTCRRDSRIKACVNVDAPGFTAALLNGHPATTPLDSPRACWTHASRLARTFL